MILGNQVEWALHCCVILASQPKESYVATKYLAEFHGVPKEYLSKALQALSNAGIIEGTLGPRGGYRLAKPANRISFLSVVEAVEGTSSTFVCKEIRENNPCLKKKDRPSAVCAIAKAMYKADEAWRKELRSVSISAVSEELTAKLPADLLKATEAWFSERV
ncbi:MAG: Rrf2 family transcriptional regulator [Proteobacteria bacterium]|nr:MAG: Rrf2 family transcriptional regulator [Pseudomonadota bacterium]